MLKTNNINFTALSKTECDITNDTQISRAINSDSYDCIINTSAYTNVNKAEVEVDLAYEVNDYAIKRISSLLKNKSTLFIHFSTDYVFDGTKKSPYTEEDFTNPINVYGKSKLNGEINLKKSNINYFIFRTSWVYDNKSNNFPNKILNLAKKGSPIRVIDYQYGVPNHVDFISQSILTCISKYCKYEATEKIKSHGVYNLSCDGQTTWFNFAKYILDRTHSKYHQQYDIKAVKFHDFKSHVKRPEFSVLNTEKIIEQFAIKIPPWQYYADKYIKAWNE